MFAAVEKKSGVLAEGVEFELGVRGDLTASNNILVDR